MYCGFFWEINFLISSHLPPHSVSPEVMDTMKDFT